MTGQVPGKDGLPGKYRYVDLVKIALFNVREDPGEEHDVAAEHPEVVAEIQAMAGAMRSRLGDALTGASGTELRDPGRVTQQN
jgi:arylsulfatase